jgi:WD40 repeat protein
VVVWDIEKGAVKHTLSGHTLGITGFTFSPDGKTLATCNQDRTVKLWDVETGGEGPTLDGPDRELMSVAFSPDGVWIAAGGASSDPGKPECYLWHVGERKLSKKLEVPAGHSLSSVAFSPDGKTLAALSVIAREEGKAAIHFWAIPDGKIILTQPAKRTAVFTNAMRALVYSPDGKTLAAPDKWPTVKLWETGPVREQRMLSADPEQNLFGVAFSPDGEMLAGCGKDHVALWNAKSGVKAGAVGLKFGAAVAFTPDGRHLVVCREDGIVVILRLKPVHAPR